MSKPAGKIRIKELARIVSGKLHGGGDAEIKGINTLLKAGIGDLSFYSGPRYKKDLKETKASCVIVPRGFNDDIETGLSFIESDNVDLAFALAAEALLGKRDHPVNGISSRSHISSSASLSAGVRVGAYSFIERDVFVGENTVIYPNVYIGAYSSIGKNSVLYPGVTIMDSVKIGEGVIIHSGTVIGSDGFGYTRRKDAFVKTVQKGGVLIGSGVEIGANTTIDRGSVSDTEIGDGTKIDNLVQVAHNVKIGKNCRIVSQVGISGSTIIEDEVILAGQAGITGHITIGSNAVVGAQAGVTKDVSENSVVSGYPAAEHRKAKRINALVNKLPGLYKKVEKLAQKIDRKEK